MNRRILWALLIETIGTVVFNVGWWMDWPPMVLFGVLLAVTGLDPDGLLPETDPRVKMRKTASDWRYELECALKDFDAQDWK